MKKRPTDLGMNQTGVGTAPLQASKTVEGARAGGASPHGDFPTAHAQILHQYREDLLPVGTMPPPSRLRGVASAARDALKGQRTNVLLDKLGERLAFERTSTRLYEGLLSKFHLYGTWPGGPTDSEIVEIRDAEHQHFRMLSEALVMLGSDPTVVTPFADVTLVESLGICSVVADPRTTLAQGLHALLVAELADNAGWELLVDSRRGSGTPSSPPGSRWRSPPRPSTSPASSGGPGPTCGSRLE